MIKFLTLLILILSFVIFYNCDTFNRNLNQDNNIVVETHYAYIFDDINGKYIYLGECVGFGSDENSKQNLNDFTISKSDTSNSMVLSPKEIDWVKVLNENNKEKYVHLKSKSIVIISCFKFEEK